jgi:hypothetical protein
MSSEAAAPDVSVLTPDGRLVAHVWRKAGLIRRAGRPDGQNCAWGSAEVFAELELVVRLAGAAGDFDEFVFKLELENLRIRRGAAQPGPGARRF